MPIRTAQGLAFRQTVTVPKTLLDQALAGDLYFNLHTLDFPSGAIRGQIMQYEDADNLLYAELDGSQEVPSVDIMASGLSFAKADRDDPTQWEITTWVFGIELDAAQAFHIHNAPAGVNGGVVVNLDPDGTLRSNDASAQAEAGFEPATASNGGRDAELIQGSAVQDLMFGARGADTIKGGGGIDLIGGDRGNDRLFGNGGADLIDGGGGNDVMRGGSGADLLNGGQGADKIFTGKGRDVVAYDLRDLDKEAGDTVKDFDPTKDRFLFAGDSGGKVRLARVSADDAETDVKGNTNVILVSSATAMTLDEVDRYIAGLDKATDDGFAVFFDADQDALTLAYFEDFGLRSAPQVAITSFGDGPDMLDDLRARNFDFGTVEDVFPL